MGEKFQEQWIEIGETGIFTTGYYLVTTEQVMSALEDESNLDGKISTSSGQREIVTTVLDTPYRISFHFFPIENDSRYLMEGMASGNAVDNILSVVPAVVKNILTEQRPVRHFAI